MKEKKEKKKKKVYPTAPREIHLSTFPNPFVESGEILIGGGRPISTLLKDESFRTL